jgi:hypothetical protein
MEFIRRLFVSPNRLDQRSLALFVFDSHEITVHHGTMYGQYARDMLKGSLMSVMTDASSPLQFFVYQGDLFERTALPDPRYGDRPLGLLRDWIGREKWGANASLLQPRFARHLGTGEPLGFVPFTIMLAGLRRGDMLRVDRALKSNDVTGYEGAVLFWHTADRTRLAKSLALPSASL